ncbi:MAG: exodeoxyribonuclease VII small subunit [Desulfurispora sp.]|uniref:exodeoxyribonuclease VII small subunit n=1 Tax=Desulfurispora sp. TaxID=3014275 RepID=UPI00404B649C
MPENRPSFEEALKELEEVVARLESGNLTLEKSLELYARGLELGKYCHEVLQNAEQQISMLHLQQQITGKELGYDEE